MGRDIARMSPRSNRQLEGILYLAIFVTGIPNDELTSHDRGRIYWLYSHPFFSDSSVNINDTYRCLCYEGYSSCFL